MKHFDNEYRKYLVERLSFFRSKANMSARDLSLRMGKSEGYIAKFEMGGINIPSEVLLDAVTILGVPYDKFFCQDPENFDENNSILNDLNKLDKKNKQIVVEVIGSMK